MSPRSDAPRVKTTCAALALLAGWMLAVPAPASAQLGSLIVTMTSPADGATVGGTVTVSASVTIVGGLTVRGVQFYLDGAPLGAEDTSAPYAITWDTTTTGNGAHALTAVARDLLGLQWTSNTVTVTVFNDTAPPAVSLTAPADGATVNGTVGVTASASDDVGVAGVQVLLDGAALGAEDTTAPYAVSWDTTTTANGSHTLSAVARDAAGHTTTSAPVTVTVANDAAPPTVSITSPASGATLSGSVSVTASASDDVGVAGVQVLLDGAALGAEDTTAPYAISWDTTTGADGAHTLAAVARDAAGHRTTSSAVTVTVSNAAPPPGETGTRFEDTDPSITWTPGTPAAGQPAAWYHGSRSRSWSDDTSTFNRSAGARATFTFTGTSVTWIGFRAPWAGIARVYVDGAFASEIDLYSPTEHTQDAIFTAGNLAAGVPHTIVVESTGQKNPSASDDAVVVDAFDVSPSTPPPAEGARDEDGDPSTAFTAGWTPADATGNWSGGTAESSATAGARATVTFTGTEVAWIGLRGPGMGIARVYLDGAYQAQVDTYAPAAIQSVVYRVTGLAPASHTLAVEVSGQQNTAATGDAIVVDAFDVRSRFEEDNPSMAFGGTWTRQNTDDNWSGTSPSAGAGTAAFSATAGSTATFTFAGTSVSWIGYRGPSAGIADVWLDGASAGRVDLYSASAAVQQSVFTASGLAPGTHTLQIVVAGAQNPAASGAFVVVDAFDVTLPSSAPPVARVQETDPSIAYTAGWAPGSTYKFLSGENAMFSGTVGAQATFTFTGSTVRWIGRRGFSDGVARVSIDGVFVAEVDTRASLQETYQAAIFIAGGLAPGTHTLTIEVVGRNGEPPGATVDPIVVDAFDVY